MSGMLRVDDSQPILILTTFHPSSPRRRDLKPSGQSVFRHFTKAEQCKYMAEQEEPVVEPKLDVDGKPIKVDDEGGGNSPKIEPIDSGDDAEPVIPVRKSAAQHIINRQSETIKKLRSKDKDPEVDPEIESEPRAGDEEDNLTPEAVGAVQKEVRKVIDPVVQSMASQADEGELKELLDNEPEAEKYEKRIRAYMKSPHYKGVPPSVIFHHLAFPDTGNAEVENAANLDAGQGAGGGRTRKTIEPGTGGKIPSVLEQNEMSDADFEALQDRVRIGEFVEGDK